MTGFVGSSWDTLTEEVLQRYDLEPHGEVLQHAKKNDGNGGKLCFFIEKMIEKNSF